VLARFGLESRPIPHLFKTEHGPYQTYYTDHTARLVSHMFGWDIAKFGYTF
jgi:hypothetical protein